MGSKGETVLARQTKIDDLRKKYAGSKENRIDGIDVKAIYLGSDLIWKKEGSDEEI